MCYSFRCGAECAVPQETSGGTSLGLSTLTHLLLCTGVVRRRECWWMLVAGSGNGGGGDAVVHCGSNLSPNSGLPSNCSCLRVWLSQLFVQPRSSSAGLALCKTIVSLCTLGKWHCTRYGPEVAAVGIWLWRHNGTASWDVACQPPPQAELRWMQIGYKAA